jgi:acyl CoA:acetate/3-ketoacid CoA transferase alpha subunit
VFETALRADVALIQASIADRAGNLSWRSGERNVNEVMAYAADRVVVEAHDLYDVGWLAPEHVMVPGLAVDQVTVAGQAPGA